MKKSIRAIAFYTSILLSVSGAAQEKSQVKFGDVTPKDFAENFYAADSNANALIIADIGSSKFEGNNKAWFSLVHKHYKRVHILNKNGYDAANVSVALYSDGHDEEQLDKLKAVTYNLENGKVVTTKLDTKSGVFKDKVDKNQIIKKFTFPNIKEGSIIEYEYTITSDFLFNLRPWEFQGQYPRLWSEYNVALPDFFRYIFLTQGYKGFDISEQKERRESFIVGDPKSSYKDDAFNIESNVNDFRWVIKNVQALNPESYTYAIGNHVTKIAFQMSEQVEPLQPHKIMASWVDVSKQLMESEDFGLALTADTYWLAEILDPIVKNASSVNNKAEKIYAYVRDNFACTNHSRITSDQSLRNVVKNRNGNVAEINLLLTAMLRSVNIAADPVILSTQSNGYTYYGYPVMNQYNYVIARANIGGSYVYLDASEPGLGFGRLPLKTYNSYARVINKAADPVELKSSLVKEVKYTTVFMAHSNGKMSGTLQQSPGYYESLNLRNTIKEKGQEYLKKEIAKDINSSMSISNFVVDSLDKFESGLSVKYNFELKDDKEDIIYVNPFFGKEIKENPFKSAQRVYPVEMPYNLDETFNLNIEIPEGYVIDELPKSALLKLNDKGDGTFEYKTSAAGNNISFRSRLTINRTYFTPAEYQMLRQFFNLVVNKQAEQIVFKKKK